MSNFEWTRPLTVEEKKALLAYKDNTWLNINPELRDGNTADLTKDQVRILDSAISKGRCQRAITLFRATGKNCLHIQDDRVIPDKAYLSTSLSERGLGQFFGEENPVLLIINCPALFRMAAFEHDDGGGEENERLLQRGIEFCIKEMARVANRFDIDKPEGPFNRHYMQLRREAILTIHWC